MLLKKQKLDAIENFSIENSETRYDWGFISLKPPK